MATSYLKIAAQIEKLQSKAAELKSKEKAGVIARIKDAIAAYELTAEDLGLAGTKGRRGKAAPVAKKTRGRKAGVKSKSKAASAPKFKDDKGNTWSGRGPRPGWFKAALESGATPESLAATN